MFYQFSAFIYDVEATAKFKSKKPLSDVKVDYNKRVDKYTTDYDTVYRD
jgi:hypothetical protein